MEDSTDLIDSEEDEVSEGEDFINMTPLVNVALVLVLIFIIT